MVQPFVPLHLYLEDYYIPEIKKKEETEESSVIVIELWDENDETEN
jgi:hypothetical protein